jgi:NTE family protein
MAAIMKKLALGLSLSVLLTTGLNHSVLAANNDTPGIKTASTIDVSNISYPPAWSIPNRALSGRLEPGGCIIAQSQGSSAIPSASDTPTPSSQGTTPTDGTQVPQPTQVRPGTAPHTDAPIDTAPARTSTPEATPGTPAEQQTAPRHMPPAGAGTPAPGTPIRQPLTPPSSKHSSLPATPSQPAGTPVAQPAAPTGATPLSKASGQNADGRPKFALTLAGGGARGAAHIGVLRALEREGLKPDYITGSSIGAIVGGLYCAGVPLDVIEQLFVHGEIKHAFLPKSLPVALATSTPTYLAKRMIGMKPPIGLYSGKRIAKTIRKYLPPGRERLENFCIPFSAIATNLLDTRPTWLSKGDAAEAIRASSSVPLIYYPVRWDGKELVDGGVRANLPTDAAEAAGAPVIVAVKLHSTLDAESPAVFRKLFLYADRILSIYLAEIEAKATGDANVVVEPDVGNMNLYSFDAKSQLDAIAAGEAAAREQMPKIRKLLRRSEGTAANETKPTVE